MNLMKWHVYRRYEKDNTEIIGYVLTTVDAKQEIALAKAYHKYVHKPYTIGYSLHVRKAEIEEVPCHA